MLKLILFQITFLVIATYVGEVIFFIMGVSVTYWGVTSLSSFSCIMFYGTLVYMIMDKIGGEK